MKAQAVSRAGSFLALDLFCGECYAEMSPCGKYRYTLLRQLNGGNRTCVFIMLNPSTADAHKDDPTIRKCIGFTKRLGYDILKVVNLYAYRATKPKDLAHAHDPVGPLNDQHILATVRDAALVLCAWGTYDPYMRARAVVEMLDEHGPLMALGLSKNGHPRHPLYMPYECDLIKFNSAHRP